VVAVAVVFVTMLVSIPAAFALSRMKFWGSTALATGVFSDLISFPTRYCSIPLFKIFVFLRDLTGIELINHWWLLIIIYPTLTCRSARGIMIGYFASIPKELDEAAVIDGCGYLQILTKILFRSRCLGSLLRHLRVHRGVGAVSLSARIHHIDRSTGAAGRHRHNADQGRRVQTGDKS